ncbi:50S ribosomal protein L29 [Candidatus Woesearchaeota archaeon]|nr:50S ribosomal protein L29 [Candidatus Woesearchaeota archaeon]
MKFKDLKALSAADKEKKFLEAKQELIKLNGQVITGTTLKSPGQIKQLKRTIAKLSALKNEETPNNG